MTNEFWPKDSEDWAFLQGAATMLVSTLVGALVWVIL